MLGGEEQEGLAGVEGTVHKAPLVLAEGRLGDLLGQLVHQHCLHPVPSRLPPDAQIQPSIHDDMF